MSSKTKAVELSKALAEPVRQWLLATAIAEVIVEDMAKVDAKILAENDFQWSTLGGKVDMAKDHGPFCRDAKLAYMITEEDADRYHEIRKAAVAECQWFVENADFCPALVAETRVTKAEQACLAMAADMMNCPQMKTLYGDKRREAIDLVTKMAISFPGFRAPSPTEIKSALDAARKPQSCLA